jgi:hypothetical protein
VIYASGASEGDLTCLEPMAATATTFSARVTLAADAMVAE